MPPHFFYGLYLLAPVPFQVVSHTQWKSCLKMSSQPSLIGLTSLCFTYLLCDPLWKLISCNKCHPGILGIFIPPEIAAQTLFHAHHWTRTTPVFLPADRKYSWLLLWSPYYHVAQCSQKTPISIFSRWQVRSGKTKKG